MTTQTKPARPATRRANVPVAVAVDLGSRVTSVWATHRGTVSGPCGDPSGTAGPLVRRGRVVDVDGCAELLSHLTRRYAEPVPPGAVIVACRPVLASDAEQQATRRVLDAAFAPSRVLFLDTVRAAAVGSGAAAGTVLVVDAGAELTEVGLLTDGRVVAARRADIGTRDLTRGATVDLIADTVVRHVEALRTDPAATGLATALARGVLLVGDGAAQPALAPAVAQGLRVRVHRAAAPRTAAINGAGLAAMSLLRHPVRS